MAEKKANIDETRKNKTLFFLIFPTFILAVLSFVSVGTSTSTYAILIVAKVLLVFWQYITLSNFIEGIYN